MPELIRSIAARMRRFVGNRRSATRRYAQHEARLQFSASLLGEKIGHRDDALPATLNGYTRDISETGLALIVPDIQIEERHLTGSDHALRVTLEFPGAPIALEAAPVRCQSLALEGREKEGSLLCVRITRMSERDRASFTKYLRKIHDPVRDFAPRVIIPVQAPLSFTRADFDWVYGKKNSPPQTQRTREVTQRLEIDSTLCAISVSSVPLW